MENVQLGTNIVVSEAMMAFRHFLYDYKAENDTNSLYIQKITDLLEQGRSILNLDLADIRAFAETNALYGEIVQTPGMMINIFEQVLNEIVQDLSESQSLKPQKLHLRVFNLDKKSSMRSLSTDNIEGLVCLQGMITRVGDLLPDLRIATFRCSACHFTLQVNRDGHRITEPDRCPNCHVANTMQVDHNGGLFADKQLIKMQEIPDLVPQGETPQSVSLYAYDDLFDSVKPGDKVDVTGIFRAVPIRVNRKQSTIKDVFRTYIDVLHFRHVSHAPTGEIVSEDATESFDSQEIAYFKELSTHPALYEELTASLAPSIWWVFSLSLTQGSQRREEGSSLHAIRRYERSHARHALRHQHSPLRRPGNQQVAAAQLRPRFIAARHLHLGKRVLGGRSHRLRQQGSLSPQLTRRTPKPAIWSWRAARWC